MVKTSSQDEPNPFESQSKGQPVQGSAGKTTSKDQPQSREQQTSRHEGSQISSQHQSQAKEHTPQASGQSALPQGVPSSSPSVTFAGHRSQSQNQPTNASYQAAPPPSASQPSQETTGVRPEFATHGAPRANPAGMALNQGYVEGAKEQAATVDPTGTSEAEEQRKRNASEFATRPVDARQ
ncbi:hypothetical protein CPB84DRAFT_1845167 [Gymnopilus junonius]|uniref:Uncharacterized protein n=1 Tax=Gymnopilus junonius TaxID=109634 RepID=A0A9P5NSL6_GYMJU|nr:hypothetical protein CPB84DRAFT_1845167 [Gymnopilus junonius]